MLVKEIRPFIFNDFNCCNLARQVNSIVWTRKIQKFSAHEVWHESTVGQAGVGQILFQGIDGLTRRNQNFVIHEEVVRRFGSLAGQDNIGGVGHDLGSTRGCH